MRNFAGTHGTKTALVLRLLQCVFAAASLASLDATESFISFTTAFIYLAIMMAIQVFWGFGLACMEAYAWVKKRVFYIPGLLIIFVFGDLLIATLSLAAASSSAGITVLYFIDHEGCSLVPECQKYQLAVALAFMSWITIGISSLILLWTLAAG